MTNPPGSWRPTIAMLSSAGAATGLAFAGVSLHRPDLVALAIPLAAWVGANAGRRASGQLHARVGPVASTLFEGQRTAARARVDAPAGTDLLTVSFAPGDWLTGAGLPDAVLAPAAAGTSVDFAVTAQRWARTRIGDLHVTAWTGMGLYQYTTEVTGRPVKIVPFRERFTVGDALPVTGGVVGTHRARRPGEGTDLAGIRPFQVGDRLKRINWPVSLRTQTLHVTATVTDIDATVMIVIDSSTDLVPGDDESRVGGTLDTAVHAAAALAEHYLHAGDRVGVLDDGQTMRSVSPATGRLHLDRIVDALIDVDTTPGRRREPVDVARILGRAAPRAMVILITPLLELARPELAVEIARRGHPVLVIDTLDVDRMGERVVADGVGSVADLAWRLQRLQHDHDIDRLADAGVPVVAWRGSGSLSQVLAGLTRAAAAPRAR